jgi:fatty acid synthase subunit alpha
MLSVTGLPYTVLSKFIEKTNATFGSSSATRKVYLSLINGMDVCSVTGHPYSLVNLQSMLRTIQAESDENQDRIPFSKRKLKFHMSFLPVSVPFHCPLLEGAVEKIMADLDLPELASLKNLTVGDFHGIPIWATNDNEPLGARKDIMHALVSMQTVQPVHWGLTCRKLVVLGVSHVIDFSRGGAASSFARLTQRNLDGTGIQVLLASTEESDDNTVTRTTNADGTETLKGDSKNTMNLKGRSAWLDLPASAGVEEFPTSVNWQEAFGPKLLKLNDGRTALRTKYTDLFNRPPLFVSGMTPCTAEAGICSAVINAGYSIELAGGGQHTPALFRQRVNEIAARTPPGEGIHINLLFLNPFLWAMQFPLALQMRREEGINIDCLTIAAGVPAPDKSDEVCEQMLEAGINKLGFKPGTAGAIAQVVDIAHRNPREVDTTRPRISARFFRSGLCTLGNTYN